MKNPVDSMIAEYQKFLTSSASVLDLNFEPPSSPSGEVMGVHFVLDQNGNKVRPGDRIRGTGLSSLEHTVHRVGYALCPNTTEDRRCPCGWERAPLAYVVIEDVYQNSQQVTYRTMRQCTLVRGRT